jgi:hypothetical protein
MAAEGRTSLGRTLVETRGGVTLGCRRWFQGKRAARVPRSGRCRTESGTVRLESARRREQDLATLAAFPSCRHEQNTHRVIVGAGAATRSTRISLSDADYDDALAFLLGEVVVLDGHCAPS